MKRISPIVLGLAVGVAAISIAAPAAGTETSNCQSLGKTVVWAQGSVSQGGQSTQSHVSGAAASPSAPAGDGCQDAYGAPINCNHT